ncbi:hypothetical protein [Stieleria maiorica]|uniref:hypothetical protein n=1 Tax=Stieleria maiorica TaxID=2795974 RepID=UPI0011C72C9F|nr:hypothetical protein [Stieleria maiorica]
MKKLSRELESGQSPSNARKKQTSIGIRRGDPSSQKIRAEPGKKESRRRWADADQEGVEEPVRLLLEAGALHLRGVV